MACASLPPAAAPLGLHTAVIIMIRTSGTTKTHNYLFTARGVRNDTGEDAISYDVGASPCFLVLRPRYLSGPQHTRATCRSIPIRSRAFQRIDSYLSCASCWRVRTDHPPPWAAPPHASPSAPVHTEARRISTDCWGRTLTVPSKHSMHATKWKISHTLSCRAIATRQVVQLAPGGP